ncbi:hypothetical protein AR1Y2_3417 [Anaerostipes rhamnosivorans]|uniref:Uncharacterized protein n=1 Tax=Anaerostipes rhamnosivorans TaxID=1229621 RepID=A0A4P8IIH9_9FIRM|nr:hypothetical protein AR1Y2_3417 [Anaerostipes rhamnosivorans]
MPLSLNIVADIGVKVTASEYIHYFCSFAGPDLWYYTAEMV